MNRGISALVVCGTALGALVACGDDDDTDTTNGSTTEAVAGPTLAPSVTSAAAVTSSIAGAVDTTTPTASAAVPTSVGTTAAGATTTAADGRVVSSPSDNVRVGDTGPGVQQIQQALAAAGYDLEADGVFGPVTDGAVRDFQQKNGLAVDGIVGPQTWAKLGATPASSTTTTAAP